MNLLRLITLCFAIVSTVSLSGCSQQQMLGGLSEADTNEAMRVLMSAGVDANKKKTSDTTWSLMVAQTDFPRAADVLKAHNLPRPTSEGLGQVFKKDSLVSSELEERARLIHALSQELQQTLMHIDGVLIARVHPVILPRDPFSLKPRVSAASVFLKYRKDADIPSKLPLIKAMVANSIEGLSDDKVTIAVFPSEYSQTLVASEKRHPAWWDSYGMVVIILSIGALGLGIVVGLLRLQPLRRARLAKSA